MATTKKTSGAKFLASFLIGRNPGLDSFSGDRALEEWMLSVDDELEKVLFVSSNWKLKGKAIFKNSHQIINASSLDEEWAYNDDDHVHLLYIDALFELSEELIKGDDLDLEFGLPASSAFRFVCGEYTFECNSVDEYEN